MDCQHSLIAWNERGGVTNRGQFWTAHNILHGRAGAQWKGEQAEKDEGAHGQAFSSGGRDAPERSA